MRFLQPAIIALLALGFVLVVRSSEAQTLFFVLDTPNPQAYGQFGSSVAMGDADGDGLADMLVGAPAEDVGANADQGRAYVFSGATGALLRVLDTPNAQAYARFGSSVAMGDADGDGKEDLLVAATHEPIEGANFRGRVYLFSGATGTLIYTLSPPNPTCLGGFSPCPWWGYSLAMGDADGDGLADMLVGAPTEDAGGNPEQGRVYLFSGATGLLLGTLDAPSPQASKRFGMGLATGDVDGDGRADILVGSGYLVHPSPGWTINQGRAYVFSGASRTLMLTVDSPDPLVLFGNAVAMGDTDGDGRAELLVGQYEPNRAYLFSGTTGALLLTLTAPHEALATGDADGDGKADLLVGAHLFSGVTGALLLTLPSFEASSDTLAMGDADGDGKEDLLVGAPWEDGGTNVNQGRAYVWLPTPPPPPGPPVVGGIAELRADPDAHRDEPASGDPLPIGASVALGVLVLSAGGLYVVKLRRG